MIELLTEPALVENALEAVGEKNRTMVGPLVVETASLSHPRRPIHRRRRVLPLVLVKFHSIRSRRALPMILGFESS